jgi:hypothetical protein
LGDSGQQMLLLLPSGFFAYHSTMKRVPFLIHREHYWLLVYSILNFRLEVRNPKVGACTVLALGLEGFIYLLHRRLVRRWQILFRHARQAG